MTDSRLSLTLSAILSFRFKLECVLDLQKELVRLQEEDVTLG